MQDGPAITHNDLPSAEGLRLILDGEATSSLRGIVSSMGHQIQIDPDDLDSFAADGDMSDDFLFTRLRRFLLELLLLCPLRVMVFCDKNSPNYGKHNIKNKWLKFVGDTEHYNTPFKGTRYTLVYYNWN